MMFIIPPPLLSEGPHYCRARLKAHPVTWSACPRPQALASSGARQRLSGMFPTDVQASSGARQLLSRMFPTDMLVNGIESLRRQMRANASQWIPFPQGTVRDLDRRHNEHSSRSV